MDIAYLCFVEIAPEASKVTTTLLDFTGPWRSQGVQHPFLRKSSLFNHLLDSLGNGLIAGAITDDEVRFTTARGHDLNSAILK